MPINRRHVAGGGCGGAVPVGSRRCGAGQRAKLIREDYLLRGSASNALAERGPAPDEAQR